MQTLQLDKDNNLVITRGALTVIDGATACAQDVKTSIGICRGEDPYDATVGIDFYNKSLGKIGGLDYLREQMRTRILAHPEVTGIRSIDADYASNTLTVTAHISSIYGEVEL